MSEKHTTKTVKFTIDAITKILMTCFMNGDIQYETK